MSRALGLAAAPLLATGLSACFGDDWGPSSRPRNDWSPPPATAQHPPLIGAISLPDFPPLGPKSSLVVSVSDADGDLDRAQVTFVKQTMHDVYGSSDQVVLGAHQLGEGFGPLNVTLWDSRGGLSTRQATDVLVDLTPPKIVLGQTVVPSQGMLELWVGDAWVLGTVALQFAGQKLTHAFEPGWPETLGKTWDYSLVQFPMKELAPGKGTAQIVATDAAGNTRVETFVLDVDGTPPLVTILSPGEGEALGAAASLSVESSDPGGGPVWVEVTLGGTPMGNLTGGKQTLSLNAGELLPGKKQLVVKATDQAGNESVAERSVVVD